MGEAIEFLQHSPDHEVSPEEGARLQDIPEAVLRDDGVVLPDLVQRLSPSQEYLQKQLFIAVARGKLTAARCLLDENATIDASVLFAACFKIKSIELFELLQEYGWNVNVVFGDQTALT